MTKDFVRYLEMCVNFHHENDESFKIIDSAYAKENLMYLKAIHYINELYSDVEGKHCVWLTDSWITLEKLFDDFVFLDDSPCGVEV